MRMNRFFQAANASLAIMALVACSSSTTTSTGGAGGTEAGSSSSSEASSSSGGGMGGGSVTCASLLTPDLSGWSASYAAANADATAFYACGCTSGNPCALVCNDPAHPSFCASTAPVAAGMCITCLTMTTGTAGCADAYNTCMSN